MFKVILKTVAWVIAISLIVFLVGTTVKSQWNQEDDGLLSLITDTDQPIVDQLVARRGDDGLLSLITDTDKGLGEIVGVTPPEIKIKGFYLGMGIQEAQALLNKYLPSEDDFGLKTEKREWGYYLDLGRGLFDLNLFGSVQADLDGKCFAFDFPPWIVESLFKSPGLKPSEFVQQFAEAYNIPMPRSYDAEGECWEYSRPDGVKIVIRPHVKKFAKVEEFVSLLIKKGKSEQEIRQAFD